MPDTICRKITGNWKLTALIWMLPGIFSAISNKPIILLQKAKVQTSKQDLIITCLPIPPGDWYIQVPFQPVMKPGPLIVRCSMPRAYLTLLLQQIIPAQVILIKMGIISILHTNTIAHQKC